MRLPGAVDRYLREALASGDVRCVLGPAAGGRRGVAHFARTPDDVDDFDLSPRAWPNLLVHLTSDEARNDPRRRPAAVLARPCETRLLQQVLSEGGLRRDELRVVGLGNCPGVIDPQRLEAQPVRPEASAEVRSDGDDFVFTDAAGDQHRLPRAEVVAERCRRCDCHQPLLEDERCELVADDDWVEPEPQPSAELGELEALSPTERWSFWRAHFERCIRCHACRDTCPLCYCEDCILERLRPRWIDRAVELSDNTAYQLQRVLHLIGRCTTCGECAEACPAGLPLHLLMQAMERDCRVFFGHTSGTAADQPHVLAIFDPGETAERPAERGR